MSLFQAILVGLIYYIANSPWPFGGMGNYAIIYRPMVAGFVVGLVLGDPAKGTMIGATINLMYIGFISAGGAMPADMSLAGVLGTALAITGNLETGVALSIAVPLGLLGGIVWVGRLTIDSFFMPIADKYVEEGDTSKVWIVNILIPQLLLFVMTFFPCFLAAYFGGNAIQGIIDALGGTVLRILSVIGGMLPAVGIALTLKMIFKGESKVFFFLGFFIIAIFKINILHLGLIGVCLMLVYMQLKKKDGEEGFSLFKSDKTAAEGEHILTPKDLRRSWWNWMYYFQSCYNYERLQGVGFLHAMSNVIGKLYADDKEERVNSMRRNVQFFNTENAMGSAIIGLVAAMEEKKKQGAPLDDDAFSSIKTGLMGPLAGIGDSIVQGVMIPVLIVFFLSMAMEGSILAPILYSIIFFALYYGAGYWLLRMSYNKGSDAILALVESGAIKAVVLGASILGCLVLGGLVASYVNVSLAVTITQNADTVISLQSVLFDAILPGLLPLLLTLGCYKLLNKGWSSIKLIVLLAVIGIVFGLIGIL